MFIQYSEAQATQTEQLRLLPPRPLLKIQADYNSKNSAEN